MRRHSADEREATRRRFVASRRHTMQVDFDRYLASLRSEAEAGAARALSAP
jgi:hypothetical protein